MEVKLYVGSTGRVKDMYLKKTQLIPLFYIRIV